MFSFLFPPAECGRRLEERDVLNGQLQRSKAGLCQSVEGLKTQLEEQSKVMSDC